MPEPTWTADHIPDQTGRTAVVTGANSGLGLATVHQLVRRGARVIMAVRDEAKGQRAAADIAAAHPDAQVQVRVLDLADLHSVRGFAEAVHDDNVRIDVLVNNAGVMMPPRTLSPQGHELQFACNHLGHFALTGLLLDLLHASDDARVVTLSSIMHHRGHIQFDDLTGERTYSPVRFYTQSKLANALFGLELHRRLRAAGGPVRSLLAHPGFAATNLMSSNPLLNRLKWIGNLLAQSADMGALPQLYAATAPDAHSGQFIAPNGIKENRGYPTVVRPAAAAEDREIALRLWQLSEQVTGVRYHFPASV